MKRKASFLLILLVSIALFYNVVGYYLMGAFKTEQTWISVMQNIPDSEFKVIKLNASLYSFTDDTEMEYVNENVTINNVSYHIFKKRTQNNIINLYYLQNYNQNGVYRKLEKIADDYLNINTNSNKAPLKKSFKSSLNDLMCHSLHFNKLPFDFETKSIKFDLFSDEGLHSGFLSSFYTPPKTA